MAVLRNGTGLNGLSLMVALLLSSCGSSGVPPHEIAGQQGTARFVIVSPATAEDDGQLWRIADHLRQETPNQTIQAMFWIDPAVAPTAFPLSDRAIETQVAQVNINPVTGQRELRRTEATRKP